MAKTRRDTIMIDRGDKSLLLTMTEYKRAIKRAKEAMKPVKKRR
jgi:hypothetical protein